MQDTREYAFVLGRVAELSILELEAVFTRSNFVFSIIKLTPEVALVKVNREITRELFNTLGGSIKFGRVIAAGLSSADITDQLKANLTRRVVGLASTVPMNLMRIALNLKKDRLIKRYVISKYEMLTSAQSKGLLQKGQEFLIAKNGDNLTLIEIMAAQDIDDFTNRDRNLPKSDPERGMLPTKIARVMVNLGLGITGEKTPIIFDPFCGMGRILMEALLVNAKVRGSDIDEEAVVATQANLAWLASYYKLPAPDPSMIKTESIEDLIKMDDHEQVDVIITEPYLGPPQSEVVPESERLTIFNEITPSYIDLFSFGKKALRKPGGVVVVFPVINDKSLLDQIVDKIQELGYNTRSRVKVSRSNQFIGREIGIFELIK